MKNHNTIIFLLFILSVFIVFNFSGCGKKGPPLPPKILKETISPPFDLKYSLKENIITLSWTHETDNKTTMIKPASFDIYMAKKTFKECAGCPFKFNKISSVNMPVVKFIFKCTKGFKYYFRVQAVCEDDIKSEYSKTVQIDYK